MSGEKMMGMSVRGAMVMKMMMMIQMMIRGVLCMENGSNVTEKGMTLI